MELGEYTVGLLFLAGTLGASLIGAGIVVARRLPRLGGVLRVLAFGLIATAVLVAVHLLPGAVGLLTRESVLALALLVLVAAWRLVPQLPGGERLDAPEPIADSGPISWGIVALTGGVLAVAVLAEITLGLRTPAEDVDTLTFQLPNIGHWIQENTFWSINQFIPLQGHGNYPNNGDLMFLAVMLPFESDALVRVVDVPFYVLAGLSVYAIAGELRAPRATAALAGLLLGALPIVHLATFSGAKTDPVFYAAFGTAILFMLRYLRLGERGELLLAGIGLGVALGTKWYGATAVPIVVAVWAGALFAQRRSVRPVLTGAATLAGLTALFAGFWLVRNWVESGSPLFPQGLPLLAETPYDFYRECVGYAVVDYAGRPGILREYLFPATREMFGIGGLVMIAGWAGATLAALLARRSRESAPRAPTAGVWVLIAAAALLALSWAVTPYTALGLRDRPVVAGPNMRYLVPAAIAALPLMAWWAGRLGRARLGAEAAVGIAVLDGVRRGFDVPLRNVVLAIALILAAAAVAYVLVRLRGRFPQRRYAVAAGGVLALVVASGLYERQRTYMDDRFSQTRPVIQRLMETPRGGQRIGLAGYFDPGQFPPVWPAFGPRMENRVEYVGRFEDGQLNEFDDVRSWRRRIEERGYDLIAVGRRSSYPRECELAGSESDDDAFARASGYQLIASEPYLNVYRVR